MEANVQSEVEKYKRRLAREKLARQQAENLLEQKSADLYEKNRELLSLSEGLEKLVAQRTAQMQKARDEALSALQVKSDFIANMSHELRTPMNGVLGVIGLLQEEAISESQQELLTIAQESGEHLLMVINNVLDFSKIEADKLDLHLAPLNMRDYIKGLCQPFELQAQQKGISFTYCIEEGVPDYLITDKLRLTQIITNLLSNAVKFTSEGGVILNMGLAPNAQSKHYRISVTDTGIGISRENQKKVFSAFEQADTSITREFGGTGLGMNITKRLVDMFGGNIHLHSTLGEGTSFYVDLSLANASLSPELTKVADDTTSNVAKSLGKANSLKPEGKQNLEGGSSILLVEDNKINQLVAKRLLENWGLHVSLAENGQEAVDCMKQNTYDLVLMDLQMPIKSGIEATIEARSKGIISENTPIIAMTAHSSLNHIDECFAAGMQGHVSKPIDKSILKSHLERFLKPLQDEPASNENDHGDASIEGVNIQDGLKRLNGDWPLLYSLIKSFIDDYANVGAQISESLHQNKVESVLALLHKIKGSGGNLGITELATSAGKAEAKLKNNQDLHASEIEALQAQIDVVKHGFSLVSSPLLESERASQRAESKEYILSKMDNIVLNLTKDVLAAEEDLKDLSRCKSDESTAGLLANAIEAMQRFDTQKVELFIQQAKVAIREV
ncbi:ATP-binding protein [Glaciecola sp. 2405UD65-10]|uniref:ATP-binding protein n=1 Tax=Glaciecola sp. 2405UD65-10 TaxID=3397244 RepID=UPI003B59B9EC